MRNIFLVLVAGLFRSGFPVGMTPTEAASWVFLFVLAVGADVALPIYLQYRMDRTQQRTITPDQLVAMARQGRPATGPGSLDSAGGTVGCDCEFCQRKRASGGTPTQPTPPGCTSGAPGVIVRDGKKYEGGGYL